jgi:hypothetical protein
MHRENRELDSNSPFRVIRSRCSANVKSARTGAATRASFAVGDRLPVVAHGINGGALAGRRDHRLGLGPDRPICDAGADRPAVSSGFAVGAPRISAHIAVCWGFEPEFLLGSGLELVGRAD